MKKLQYLFILIAYCYLLNACKTNQIKSPPTHDLIDRKSNYANHEFNNPTLDTNHQDIETEDTDEIYSETFEPEGLTK